MSSYFKGLKTGDLVYASYKNFFSIKAKINFLVLEKIFLFEQETRYGIRRFYEYDVMCTKSNSLFKIKTQDMRVLKITSSRK